MMMIMTINTILWHESFLGTPICIKKQQLPLEILRHVSAHWKLCVDGIEVWGIQKRKQMALKVTEGPQNRIDSKALVASFDQAYT